MTASSDQAPLPVVPGTENDSRSAEDALAALRGRRDGGERLPAPAAPLDLVGQHLIKADLAGLDLSRCDFSGAELSGADLSGTRLVGAKLAGTVLHAAQLDDAELLGAEGAAADFSNVSAQRAGFGRTTLRGASFFEADLKDSTFSGSDLRDCDLRVAKLDGSRAVEADLRDADLVGASLRDVDLTGASVAGASLLNVDLRAARLRGIKDYATAAWVGADIRDVDFAGAWLLRRHVLDENYIAEFRSQSRTHEIIYRLWWISSDCGRSLARWTLWSVFVALIFAGIYTQVDLDYGAHETWLSPIYYSVVTFTTLGYGDVLPASVAAQVIAMVEVVLGYVALGGLLAILADKLARRAG
jgi:uncharacterized protein YjbI with pentapeptide repeats